MSQRRTHDVLLIRGAPGVGKTTLASLLPESFPDGAVIDIDSVRSMIVPERFRYRHNRHYRIAVDAVAAQANYLLSCGTAPIVIVDVFSLPILRRLKKHLSNRRIVIFSLAVDNAALCRRMSAREHGFLDLKVARKVNAHLIASREPGELVIETGAHTPYGVRALLMARWLERNKS